MWFMATHILERVDTIGWFVKITQMLKMDSTNFSTNLGRVAIGHPRSVWVFLCAILGLAPPTSHSSLRCKDFNQFGLHTWTYRTMLGSHFGRN